MLVNRNELVVALAILAFVVLACDGGSRALGHVLGPDGEPVDGATVKFDVIEEGKPANIYQRTVRTDKNGIFDARITHAVSSSVDLRLTVSKPGYKTLVYEFSAEDALKKEKRHEDFKIVLEKD